MRRGKLIIPTLLAVLASGPVAAEVIDIDNQQLKQLLASGVPLVDVRTAAEWQETGVVDNSHLLTFFDAKGRYDARKWLNDLAAVAKPDRPVILICRTGNRSAAIARFLDQQPGNRTIYNVRGGIRSWRAEGNPTAPPAAASEEPAARTGSRIQPE